MTSDTIKILGDLDVTALFKVQKLFEDALAAPKNDLTRDATIQRFEFTFELVWKILKRILKYKGLEINNPRDVFRHACKEKLIESPDVWFEFLENRNRTVHSYNVEVAESIYASLPNFKTELEKVLQSIKKL